MEIFRFKNKVTDSVREFDSSNFDKSFKLRRWHQWLSVEIKPENSKVVVNLLFGKFVYKFGTKLDLSQTCRILSVGARSENS